MTFESFVKILNILNLFGVRGYFDKNRIIKEKLNSDWRVYIKFDDKLYTTATYRENEDGMIDASLDLAKEKEYDFKEPKDIRDLPVIISNKHQILFDIFEDELFKRVLTKGY